jgi:heptaprenyl diphosphate synthase
MTFHLDMQVRNTKTARLVVLGIFTAAAVVLQSVENIVFPSALPFGPGLANMITIMILAVFGAKEAIAVTVVRTVIASAIGGKFLGIPFILGLSGGLASAAVMGMLFRFTQNDGNFGIMGLSIIGATTHNFTQLAIVSLLIMPAAGTINLLPWLWSAALIAGSITALICIPVLNLPVIKKLTFLKKDSTQRR